MSEQSDIDYKEKYPMPDPTWDYYEIWNICLNAKVQIEKALSLMEKQEVASENSDIEIFDSILSAMNGLETIDFKSFKSDFKKYLPDEPG